MKYWYYTEGNNASSSYTDFTSMNNGSASGYTDFTGFGNSYADRNSESFRSGYNDYSGFGSGYTEFTQPAQNAQASGYTGYAAASGYAAAGANAAVINRSVRQAPTFVKAAADGTKKKKGAGKLVIGAFAAIAVMLGAALGAKYFMTDSDNFISKIFSELGGKATEAASEIPLGQEGFAKYTIPTKPDKSSKTAKGAAAGGAAAGDEDGEHRDVYDIADKIKGAGFLAILLGIISLVYRTVVELISKNGGNFVKSDGYMDLGYPFIYSVLILGVVLMIIAYVFNYGYKLQQESDETL